MEDEEGGICGKVFQSYKGLTTHIRRRHDRRDLLSLLTVTNQCPWCMSTFLTRDIAVAHVRRSCNESGVCREGLSKWARKVQEVDSYHCPVCEHEAFCLEHA